MKLTLIHNESAGSGVSSDELERIIGSAGHRIVRSVGKDELDDLDGSADWLADSELLVVAGGDGTVQRVAAELAGSDVPLAILPLGTANNIASSLGIDGPTEELVRAWGSARRMPLDLGVATGRWGVKRFIESVGGGLVANGIVVMDRAKPHDEEQSPEDMLGKALHRFRVVLSGMTPRRCRLVVDGEESEPELLLCEILNVRAVGPGLLLAPSADLSDGRFDVVTAGEAERALIDRYLDDRHEGRPARLELPTRRARRVGLGGWDRLHVDDTIHEDIGETSVLAVCPAALKVLVPS